VGAGLAATGWTSWARAAAGPAPDDFIDPATLRPRPRVRVAATFLEMPRPVWLGWPGTTYDLDGHQQEYAALLEQSAGKLGIEVARAPQAINSEDGMNGWLQQLKASPPDGVLIMLQHMQCWTWVTKIAQETGIPVLVFAPVGTAFTGHVDQASRLRNVHVISTLAWSAVEDALRMVRAKRMFEETRVLWIHGNRREETVLDRLGVKVRAIPRDTFNLEFDKQTVTEEVRDVATDLRSHAQKIVEPTEEDIVNAARAYLTAKRLLATENANALSMDCLGMVGARLVPTPPCGAWTLLQDQGITAGCEADLFGAVSMMMTSYLLDRPGYMNDPVPETYRNLLIAAHCTSGTRLDGFDKPPAPYVLRDHSESSLGVATQVLWPVGQPATLVRCTSPHEMIIDTGTVAGNVDTPPAGGCRTSVELQMDDIEDCRDVKGFHQVVTLGHHRRILEGFCELYGIKHIHSPRQSTFATGDSA
jgi:L-fucose isomerase-like protein